MKKIIFVIMSAAFVLARTIYANQINRIKEKYQDAFKREAELFKNPEFYNKFAAIKDAYQTHARELQLKQKITSINVNKEIEQIKKTYEQTFAQVQSELSRPHNKKFIVDPMLIPIVNDEYNSYYYPIIKALDDLKSAVDKYAHQLMPRPWEEEQKELKEREDSEIAQLVQHYDPELRKAYDEVNAITNNH